MEFKITIKQQLLLLGPLFIKNGVLLVIYLYFFGFTFSTPYYFFILFFILFFDILPTIILHIQYLLRNWKAVLIIDKKLRSIGYKAYSKTAKYSFDDIFAIQHVASYGGGSGIYSFGEYRYYKIIFNDKNEIIITCLMVNNIKKVLENLLDITADKKLKVIAFITQ